MKIGFLFPGQGSQSVGMGKDLYENFEEYRNIYEEVKKVTDIDVAKITFEKEDVLNQTKYTQLCILTMSMAILKLLKKENINAAISMGLSLGEYSALIYSGCLNFEDGIKLVKKRGKYMQDLVPDGEWSMSAIIGLDEKTLRNICNSINSGFVTLANFNCIGQIAISGEKVAVEEAMIKAKEMGAKRAVPLKTSGPFHTKMLSQASEKLKEELENVRFNNFETPVIKNIDGQIYKNNDNIRDILSKHIISPVRFTESIKTMLDYGVDTFIEIGPGRILTSFVKKTDQNVKLYNINDKKSFEETVLEIKRQIKS